MPDQATQHVAFDLLERMNELIRTGTTDMAPSMMQVPLEEYNSQERHERELAAMFRTTPLCAAPSATIANAGDYTTRDVLDRSLLISRGADGEAHVVLNYCTHRGAIIATGDGCTKRHACPYHGWAFDPAGTLVGIPGADGFEGLDRSKAGLVKLPTVEAYGFIWCVLDPNGSIDIEADLGDFGAELGRWGYENFWKVAVYDHVFPANWKTTMEAFSETYHFPYVHGGSIGPGVIANTSTFDLFADRHHRIGTALTPMRGHTDNGEPFDPLWHTSLLYWKCPDLMLANTPMGVEVVQVTPTLDVNQTRLRHTMMARSAPTNDEEREIALAMSVPAANAILLEDGPTLSTCGRGLSEGEHGHATIGRNEPGVQNIHNQARKALGES